MDFWSGGGGAKSSRWDAWVILSSAVGVQWEMQCEPTRSQQTRAATLSIRPALLSSHSPGMPRASWHRNITEHRFLCFCPVPQLPCQCSHSRRCSPVAFRHVCSTRMGTCSLGQSTKPDSPGAGGDPAFFHSDLACRRTRSQGVTRTGRRWSVLPSVSAVSGY